MNTDQILSIVRSALKLVGAYLVAHGMSSSNTELVTGCILAVAGFFCSHLAHADESDPSKKGGLIGLWLALGLLAFVSTGCGTVYNSNKITAVKERGFGIVIAESPANQTPEVKLGFFSSVIQIIPTSTNGAPVEVPRYMDTFDLANSANPLDTSIKEVTGTGSVIVGQGTNDTSKAIVPSAYTPK